MLITLSQSFVLKLNFEQIPALSAAGRVEFKANDTRAAYIVFDEHRDAPRGFGVKVTKTAKSYLVQRRVGAKVIKSKVGDVRDFATIDAARARARSIVAVMLETKQNANKIAKQRETREITLGRVFDDYRVHLTGRPDPATQNTLLAYDKARKRLEGWMSRKVRELSAREILGKFDELALVARTATEQTFRWATAAVRHAVKLEALDAAAHDRDLMLTHNPLDILSLQRKFRSRSQLEMSYEAKGVRTPMERDELGPFLDALWSRREKNRTGCDYLLLCLIWGDRKTEPTRLMWRDMLTAEEEAAMTPYVDLKRDLVFFGIVKSRRTHSLPLTTAAKKILSQRYNHRHAFDEHKKRFVFPACSPASKTGHYSDARSLLGYIRDEARVAKLTMHDLRRTFGRVAEELGIQEKRIKRLIGHIDSSNLGRYTHAEDQSLKEDLEKIENAIISKSETLKRALDEL